MTFKLRCDVVWVSGRQECRGKKVGNIIGTLG